MDKSREKALILMRKKSLDKYPIGVYKVRKETKHCRIFAQQMYGEITCVAGYRSVSPERITKKGNRKGR